MLELRQVTKRYGAVTALHPTDLVFERGKTTALLGPSGCGKSTLLRSIMGLIQPDGGTVSLDGEVLTPDNVLQMRRRMGYMIQDGGLFPHLTVAGNVGLMARYLGWSKDRIAERTAELASLTQLPQQSLTRFPSQISGGQRQRVALMRALFLDPDLVLLDEPMGALDPMIRNELQQELREIFRSLDKTVIVVTHDIGEAGFLADVIALLREGQILQLGSLRELVHSPQDAFVSEFLNAQRSPLESLEEPQA